MDDHYPGMTINHPPLLSIAEVYIYGSAVLGIAAVVYLICFREPRRVYRIMKRKNTDDSPIIQA
jgi:hypothetical protein